MEDEFVCEFNNINKSFSGAQVLFDVSCKFKKGKVVALMGENGAGKSTLMKIFAGEENKDSGEIVYNGKIVNFRSPKEALQSGIVMIHQTFNLVLDLSISSNLFLGREFMKSGFAIDHKKMRSEAKKVLNSLSFYIDPDTQIRNLSMAQRQMVEIVKAISHDANVIIMDEPTSALEDTEVKKLFSIVRQLKKEGRTIIFITHKLNEMFEISDDLVILRDGHYIGSYLTKDVTKDDVVFKMVNRQIKDIYPKRSNKPGKVILEVKNFTKNKCFKNINFDLHEGEILGFAGLVGSGRTDVAESIFGISNADSGEVYVNGTLVRAKSTWEMIKLGVGLIPDDQKLKGLVLCRDVKENICLSAYDLIKRSGLFLNNSAIRGTANEYIKKLGIKSRGNGQLVGELSGGNQQKVVVAKWLLRSPRVIIMDEPTQGIDIGAKSDLYLMISQLAAAGNGIIFITSDQSEIIGLCDRVLVFHEGQINGQLSGSKINLKNIMNYAVGIESDEQISEEILNNAKI